MLLRRRTQRGFDAQGELSVDQLSVLLRYVWGAHAYGHDGRGAPVLAKTSPSGGSLHPIEVYALLAGVRDVEPGLYHYSVGSHALELMDRIDPAAVRELADHFMQSPLLEAGHFSQTLLPRVDRARPGRIRTSVINHADIDNRLGLDPYREGVLAICGCGRPGDTPSVVHDKPFVPRETELD